MEGIYCFYGLDNVEKLFRLERSAGNETKIEMM